MLKLTNEQIKTKEHKIIAKEARIRSNLIHSIFLSIDVTPIRFGNEDNLMTGEIIMPMTKLVLFDDDDGNSVFIK